MPRMIPGLFYYDKIFYYDKKGENRKMNTSGEAAEQVMRMSLEGAEILIKLTGSGAKNAAVLLYSIYKEQNKTRGKERLTNMLRSGKPLKVYTFKRDNLEKFKEVAKEYGILYTVLKEKEDKDGVFDVLVRADDDSKLARVIERFKFSGVDTAEVRTSMQKEKAEKGEATPTAPAKEEEFKENTEEPEKEKETTEPEQAESTVTAQVGDDEEKETPERTAPTKEQNLDDLAILTGEKPATENPTMARQGAEEPLPESSSMDEGKAVTGSPAPDRSGTEPNGKKSLTMSSLTETEPKPQEGESTSQPKSKESGADGYKTPDGRVDISDVIRRKKEARSAQAKAAKELPAKDLPLPKKDKKER